MVYVFCLLFVGVGFDLAVRFPDRFLFLVKAANRAEGFVKDAQDLATKFHGLATIFLKGHVSGVCSAKFSNNVIFF
jgi:hypothetical protein